MELHQLRYFVQVADLGNFTRAAEKCFVSQPSLSQQIIKLEKELKGPLFDRTGRKVKLTDAGKIFYDRATDILANVDAAKRELTEESDVGTIAVGAIPTIAPYLLPSLLKRFTKKFPKAELTVYENLTEFTIKSCLEGEIDIGLLALPIENEQLDITPLFNEELLLVMPAGHRLQKKRKITIQEMINEPFVLLSETHCLGEHVLSFCKQQSYLPVVSCHSAQLLTVQELVTLGHGISLIPQMAVNVDKSKKRIYRSLTSDKPTRTIAMICRKNRYQSPLVQEFAKFIQQELNVTTQQ